MFFASSAKFSLVKYTPLGDIHIATIPAASDAVQEIPSIVRSRLRSLKILVSLQEMPMPSAQVVIKWPAALAEVRYLPFLLSQ